MWAVANFLSRHHRPILPWGLITCARLPIEDIFSMGQRIRNRFPPPPQKDRQSGAQCQATTESVHFPSLCDPPTLSNDVDGCIVACAWKCPAHHGSSITTSHWLEAPLTFRVRHGWLLLVLQGLEHGHGTLAIFFSLFPRRCPNRATTRASLSDVTVRSPRHSSKPRTSRSRYRAAPPPASRECEC